MYARFENLLVWLVTDLMGIQDLVGGGEGLWWQSEVVAVCLAQTRHNTGVTRAFKDLAL